WKARRQVTPESVATAPWESAGAHVAKPMLIVQGEAKLTLIRKVGFTRHLVLLRASLGVIVLAGCSVPTTTPDHSVPLELTGGGRIVGVGVKSCDTWSADKRHPKE